MKTLLPSWIFRMAAGFVLAAAFVGCVAPAGRAKTKKLVAIADVCKTNGFISARVTNSDAIAAAGFLPVLVPSLADTNTVAEMRDLALSLNMDVVDYLGKEALEIQGKESLYK